jgi:hypothetical protein
MLFNVIMGLNKSEVKKNDVQNCFSDLLNMQYMRIYTDTSCKRMS